MRIAAEKAALAVPYNQGDDPPCPTEEELEAELNAGDAAAAGASAEMTDLLAVMWNLESKVNPSTVKRFSKMPWKKRTKKTAKTAPKPKPQNPPPGTTKPAPEPLGARVGRSQPPPMRRTDELPKMYHHGEINWYLLRKHMTLSMYYHALPICPIFYPIFFVSFCSFC